MFIRRNKNRSGTISIQIVKKVKRSNKVIKTVGIAETKREEELLILFAKGKIERFKGTQGLFVEHDDLVVDSFVESIANDHLQIVGPELILGNIYDKIGFPSDGSCIAQNRKISLRKIRLDYNKAMNTSSDFNKILSYCSEVKEEAGKPS